MGAIAVHHTKTDTKSAWDGPAEVAAAPNDHTVLRYMHAYAEDGGDPDQKQTYKDPHHKHGTDTAANIHGVNNGLSRLAGTKIPQGEKPGVEKHLRAHRKDAGLSNQMDENEILEAVNTIAEQDQLTAEEKQSLLAAVQENENSLEAVSPSLRTPIRCFEGQAKPHEPFWSFRAASESGGDAILEFYGVISEYSWLEDVITPKKFKDDLYNIGKGGPITMQIDSPGGDPIAASTISSIIANYPGKVTAQIEGEAASAAVMIVLSASHIRIMDSAYMMIHDPAVNIFLGVLDISILTALRDTLKTIKGGMVQTYAKRTGLSEDRVAHMMTDETWMNAQDAVNMHFADEVVNGGQKRPARAFQNYLRDYEHVPDALLNLNTGPAEPPLPVSSGITAPEIHQAAPGGAEGGQPKAHVQERVPYAARVALAMKRIQQGEPIMNVRELLQARSKLVDEANRLATTADNEKRDFTDEERARFDAIIVGTADKPGEIAALDQQIERINAEREQLRLAAEKQFPANPAIKPEPQAPKKVLKRVEFDALSGPERAKFIRAGGKIQD